MRIKIRRPMALVKNSKTIYKLGSDFSAWLDRAKSSNKTCTDAVHCWQGNYCGL